MLSHLALVKFNCFEESKHSKCNCKCHTSLARQSLLCVGGATHSHSSHSNAELVGQSMVGHAPWDEEELLLLHSLLSSEVSESAGQLTINLKLNLYWLALRKKGVQYFLRGTVGDTVYPKDMWHGGANYPRISCTGVPKRGDVRITVTPERNKSEIFRSV